MEGEAAGAHHLERRQYKSSQRYRDRCRRATRGQRHRSFQRDRRTADRAIDWTDAATRGTITKVRITTQNTVVCAQLRPHLRRRRRSAEAVVACRTEAITGRRLEACRRPVGSARTSRHAASARAAITSRGTLELRRSRGTARAVVACAARGAAGRHLEPRGAAVYSLRPRDGSGACIPTTTGYVWVHRLNT